MDRPDRESRALSGQRNWVDPIGATKRDTGTVCSLLYEFLALKRSEDRPIDAAAEAVGYAHNQAARVASSKPTDAASAPTLFVPPGYEFLGIIHRGGQGAVYKAIQKSTDRLVAVKVLRHGALSSPTEHARFSQEIRALAGLRHPNIVRLYDGDSAHGVGYIVMDFIDGVPLSEYVKQLTDSHRSSKKSAKPRRLFASMNGSSSAERSQTASSEFDRGSSPSSSTRVLQDEIARLFVKVCDAVHTAHLRGIIHRDLKPNNILVDSRGEPHILDFGLAKIVGSNEGGLSRAESITETGQFVGSLLWSCPEQVRGDTSKIDVRSDVFSIGALLYQSLAGRAPFDADRPPVEVMNQILHEEPTSLRSISRDISVYLQIITLHALQKDPSKRYQSASDLRADLEAYLRGEAPSVSPDTTWLRFRRIVSKHRVLSAIVGLVITFILVYSASVTVLLQRTRLAERQQAKSASDARIVLESTLDAFRKTIRQANELSNMPGAGAWRRMLLDAYADSFRSVAEKSLTDLGLRRQYAHVISKLADLAYEIEDRDENHLLREAALKMREELVAENPNDPDLWRDLATELVLGDWTLVGTTGEARDERSLVILERLVAEHPDKLSYCDDLFWSYHRFGGRALDRADYQSAWHYLKRQQTIVARLVAIEPNNPIRLKALRNCHHLMSHFFARTHDPQSAMIYQSLEGDVLEQLYRFNPEGIGEVSELAGWHAARAIRLNNCGDMDAALFHADRAAELAEPLGNQEKDQFGVWELQYAVASAYCQIHFQNSSDSLSYYQHALEAVRLCQVRLERNSEIIHRLAELAVARAHCATASFRLGKSEHSRDHAAEFWSLFNELTVRDDPQSWPLVAIVSDFLVNPDTPDLYHPTLAIEALGECRDACADDSVYWNTMAMARNALGEHEAALAAIEKAAQLMPQVEGESLLGTILKEKQQTIGLIAARRLKEGQSN